MAVMSALVVSNARNAMLVSPVFYDLIGWDQNKLGLFCLATGAFGRSQLTRAHTATNAGAGSRGLLSRAKLLFSSTGVVTT